MTTLNIIHCPPPFHGYNPSSPGYGSNHLFKLIEEKGEKIVCQFQQNRAETNPAAHACCQFATVPGGAEPVGGTTDAGG
jgi:hypothetical protein